MAKKGPRKKLPKELAVINADNCTGCESCLEVCPVDCIDLLTIDRGVVKGTQQWCEIDLERCVGCEVCVHIPQKKSNPYELLVCPWDAIEMVPTEQVAQVVAEIGDGATWRVCGQAIGHVAHDALPTVANQR